MGFLHGIETVDVTRANRSVRLVKTAIIALIGTAPIGPVNRPILVLSDKDAAQFGPIQAAYSMGDALDSIFDQGNGSAIICVNVLDPAVHRTAVASEALTLDANTGAKRLAKVGAIANTVVIKNAAKTVTYVQGTDYTLDGPLSLITRTPNSAIAAGATVLDAAYSYADASKVTAADIIGGVNAAGVRTGLQALKDCTNLFGFNAKRVICPGYSTLNAVASAMLVLADQLKMFALIDAPLTTTLAQALAGRGPLGTINFNTSSRRAVLCMPHVKKYDVDTNADRLVPLSAAAAGAWAVKDSDKGFWWSPSNTEIKGITGIERQFTFAVDDQNSEVNTLNSVGITTIANGYGTGLRLWGNRSAAWPVDTHFLTFVACQLTRDVIDESIRMSALPFSDQPITQPLIDAVVEYVNSFLRKLQGDGAILGGKAYFDGARNPENGLTLGQLVISYKFTPVIPLERLTFESEVTGEYLLTLKG